MAKKDSLAARRRHVVQAMDEITAASKELKTLFGRLEVVTRKAVGQVEQGARMLDVVESMGLADQREHLNAAAARVRQGRHELQLAMFLLAEAEGASRAEIARAWRVSRQLISRMIRESS